MNSPYIGRFAPSPTGPLHFGTLIAAVASYLQAKVQEGTWLLRIEDVDTKRTVSGMADNILRTMENFGFEWQQPIVFQTQRTELYEQALQTLSDKNLVFPCTCSRKILAANNHEENTKGIYPGSCRARTTATEGEYALRIRVGNSSIEFEDRVMGAYRQNLEKDCGDFVIKRRDGLFAYQLAVVVDDALQGVTEVVRGTDLLDSTPRQIYLQQQLGYEQPGYLHLPLVINEHQQKVSKLTGAPALDSTRPVQELCAALRHLGQTTPQELEQESLGQFWEWAIKNWDSQKIPKHDQPLP
jgi:glutamyl-Q tRNA(Asp) synthetase